MPIVEVQPKGLNSLRHRFGETKGGRQKIQMLSIANLSLALDYSLF
jgi:hypothetical protein